MSHDKTAEREFWIQLGVTHKEMLEALVKGSRIERIFKGDIIAEQNSKVTEIAFLLSGIVKGYWTDIHQDTHVFCFGYHTGEPLVALRSMKKELISFCTLEVVKSGKALYVPASLLYEHIHSNIEGSMIYAMLLEKSYQEMVEREQNNYSLSAAERYEWFQQKYPGLEQRITAKDIASFLNITPSSLSRLKARFLKGG